MGRLRILLADDHEILVDGLKSVLEPQYEVVGTALDGRALLDAAAKLLPDIIVLDIGMPELNGLDAARQLKRTMPKVKLIFLTVSKDPYIVGEAFRAGASAFLLKQSAVLELTDAIQQVVMGRSYVTPRVSEGLTGISLRSPEDRENAPQPTPRQREVIQLLAEGRSMKAVADVLHITPRTVAEHKYNVMELLQLKSNSDLVQYAIKHGIISLQG